MDLLRYAKAFVAAAVAAGATTWAAASAAGGGAITQQEWGVIVGSALVAGVLVFLTPNKAAVR